MSSARNAPTDSLIRTIAGLIQVRETQVAATVALLDDGNTLPFIARYRKEATGGLDEEQIRLVSEHLERLRALEERRAVVLASIEAQGNLTDELRARLAAAETLTAIEDLYQPFRPKRRTRASIARERGLAPLADLILAQQPSRQSAAQIAAPFVGGQVPTPEDALAGARDIVAEIISDHPDVRSRTRDKASRWGVVHCARVEGAADERGVFQTYYQFDVVADRVQPYQVLALNRGESEGVLRVSFQVAERDWRDAVRTFFRPDSRSPLAAELVAAIDDAAERLLLPAIERDVRRLLTERAEEHAIQVFADNLRGLLRQPPLAGRTVLGIDPGFRTGCKVALVDATGKLLATTTIYPHTGGRGRSDSLTTLAKLVVQHGVSLIAIGNGTASRETEQLVADLIHQHNNKELHYLIVNEAGASVYSASPLARAELPELDVSLRGAVSIARRVQDPLAELVKIDPQSIGVGLYQHDVNQTRLRGALAGVVEGVVNHVGVDVNTASPALLAHVSGLGPKLAERIVAFRDENGPFRNRKALRNVPSLGPKAFQQAAGFLRIRDGDTPLDASAIHPESYHVAEAVLRRANLSPATPPAQRQHALAVVQTQPLEQLAAELGAGVPTLRDVFEQLVRPGRDPRDDMPAPLLRSDVLSLDDLQVGMQLQGTVRNIVDFGAFVDIGVKQDGLLHRSRIPRGAVLHVGMIVSVEVAQIEQERGRIGLLFVRDSSSQ